MLHFCKVMNLNEVMLVLQLVSHLIHKLMEAVVVLFI